MLYQELPRIDSSPLDGWGRWLAPALIVAVSLTAGLVLALIGQQWLAVGVVVGGALGALLSLRRPRGATIPAEPLIVGPDYSMVGAALSISREPVALTDG